MGLKEKLADYLEEQARSFEEYDKVEWRAEGLKMAARQLRVMPTDDPALAVVQGVYDGKQGDAGSFVTGPRVTKHVKTFNFGESFPVEKAGEFVRRLLNLVVEDLKGDTDSR